MQLTVLESAIFSAIFGLANICVQKYFGRAKKIFCTDVPFVKWGSFYFKKMFVRKYFGRAKKIFCTDVPFVKWGSFYKKLFAI